MSKLISSMVLLFAVNATVLGQGGELGAGGREPARFAERNFPGPSLLFLSVRNGMVELLGRDGRITGTRR